MTKTNWLCKYVGEIQYRLFRRDIKVTIEQRHSDEGTYAQVIPHEQAHEAVIRFSPDFFSDTPEGQRDTVIHELLHLHFVLFDDAAYAWVDKLAPVDYSMLKRMLNRAEERTVDIITRIIAPSMPLPPRRKR